MLGFELVSTGHLIPAISKVFLIRQVCFVFVTIPFRQRSVLSKCFPLVLEVSYSFTIILRQCFHERIRSGVRLCISPGTSFWRFSQNFYPGLHISITLKMQSWIISVTRGRDSVDSSRLLNRFFLRLRISFKKLRSLVCQ